MELKKLLHRALELRRQYEQKEIELYGSARTDEEIASGFAGDVNNLVKLIAAEHGKRNIENSRDKLAAQLAHSLWSVLVLADMHKVDLETAFMEAMDRLESHMLEAEPQDYQDP
jgi:NTP pyrophosphatase (non-canonical NTP hydrolase)